MAECTAVLDIPKTIAQCIEQRGLLDLVLKLSMHHIATLHNCCESSADCTPAPAAHSLLLTVNVKCNMQLLFFYEAYCMLYFKKVQQSKRTALVDGLSVAEMMLYFSAFE